jgi:hypothetical protein
VSQRFAGHELEHKEIDTPVGVEIKQRCDVGMEQLRKGARFESETALRTFVVKRVLLKHLKRHVALESWIVGAEHDAHTTFAQAFDDPVPAERLTDHGGSGMEWGGQGSPEVYAARWHWASLGEHKDDSENCGTVAGWGSPGNGPTISS